MLDAERRGEFANPALAVGRMLSDTFAGIAPASVPPFVAAEVVGGLVGIVLIRSLFAWPAHAVVERGAPSVGRNDVPDA